MKKALAVMVMLGAFNAYADGGPLSLTETTDPVTRIRPDEGNVCSLLFNYQQGDVYRTSAIVGGYDRLGRPLFPERVISISRNVYRNSARSICRAYRQCDTIRIDGNLAIHEVRVRC